MFETDHIFTDPKNTDYEMESGATRHYQVHKDRVKTEEEVSAEKQLKEKEKMQ